MTPAAFEAAFKAAGPWRLTENGVLVNGHGMWPCQLMMYDVPDAVFWVVFWAGVNTITRQGEARCRADLLRWAGLTERRHG